MSVHTFGDSVYKDWLMDSLKSIEKNLPQITRSAEEAARLFVNEGYGIGAAGDSSFVDEFSGRAGGIMPIQPGDDKTSKTIILIPLREDRLKDDLAQATTLKQQGNFIVAFARKAILDEAKKAGARFDAVVETHAAPHGGLFQTNDGRWVVPTDPVANIVSLWTWTGEFVSACTRLGKMPVIWQSIRVPGSSERNGKYTGMKFHEGTPAPIGSGQAGREYLSKLRKILALLYSEEHEKIRIAARFALQARKNGKPLYLHAFGHALTNQLGCAHDPGYFVHLNDGWFRQRKDVEIKQGDFILCLGYDGTYSDPQFGDFMKDARKAGAKLVWAITTYNKDEIRSIPTGELLIDQHWELGDALVDVPGYDVNILPPSGVLAEAILWMINADIMQGLESRQVN